MSAGLNEEAVSGRAAVLERLLGELDELPEPARSVATDTVRALAGLYGEALGRIVERLQRCDPARLEELAGDELVSHLLILHDLHPTQRPLTPLPMA
ncbi:MAG: hypothetical protein QOE72_4841 [Chloroflexota bacterium]|jgi:hypothetical protein|nr:hypothetical protein [Chloroflexota bacterium]